MKKLLFLSILFLSTLTYGQQNSISEFYPKLKKTETRKILFQGCVSGNCRTGEGTYMTIKSPTSGSGNGKRWYKSTIYVFRGIFYKNGEKLVGKEYGFKTKYTYKPNSRKMVPSYQTMLDGSDPKFNEFLNYEGELVFKNNTYVRQGSKAIMHYELEQHEDYDTFLSDTYNGYMNKRYITYKSDQPYRSYEGWFTPGDQFSTGKLVLANGDIYQGTFFNNKYHGYGRLKTSSGEKEGFWRDGELVKEEKITIPDAGLNGNLLPDTYKWLKILMYDNQETSINYFGNLTNDKPEGQGLTFNYYGQINSGNFKDGLLNGLGYRLTTKKYVQSKNTGYYPHIKETGVFKNGRLIDGIREEFRLKKRYKKFTYSKISEEQISPSAAVNSQTAIAENVETAGKSLQDLRKEADRLLQNRDYAKALYLYKELIPSYGYDNRLSAMTAFCYLMLKDIENAEKFIKQAHLINPSDYVNYAISAYILVAKDEMKDAKKAMDDAIWFHNTLNVAELQEDLPLMIENEINPGGTSELQNYIKTQYPSRNKAYVKIDETMNKAAAQIGQNNQDAKNLYNQGIAFSAKISDKPWLKGLSLYIASASFYYNGFYDEAYTYLQLAFEENQGRASGISPYIKLFVSTILAEFAANSGDFEKVNTYLTEGKKQLVLLGDTGKDMQAKYYDINCRYYQFSNNNNGLISSAQKLLNLEKTGYDAYYNTLANSYLGNAYINNIEKRQREKGQKYLEKAFTLAEENKFEPLRSNIQGSLALSYWQNGNKQKARDTYNALSKSYLSRKMYLDAEVSINNLAYLYFYDKNYAQAATYFQQAADITEQARKNLKLEDRVNFFQGKLGAYQGLIYSLAKQNNVEVVFNTQQKDRARVLLENLIDSKDKTSISLKDFQSSLDPDEIAIFYSLFNAGEVTITSVSNNSATVKVVDQKTLFLNLKSKYLDRLNKGKSGYSPINVDQAKKYANTEDRVASQLKVTDFNSIMELLRGLIDESIKTPDANTRNLIISDLLNQYHQFLIAPIENELAGKNEVIIFPDGILNFLPFEALKAKEGKFLVERMNVRYGRSVDVSSVLKARKYAIDRKPFLGMGGAEYNKMTIYDQIDRANMNYNILKISAAKNTENGNSQRQIYASLFGEKMNYLEGTLKEVTNLSKIFNNATVYKGTEMTESLIKKLSNNGQLRDYKIVHLATHGFSLPDFPELSGIAMTIFPEEQNGEDGYLTAPEISKLDMNADLVVLSACETALGKIYGGEGVEGLTQSLLEGGANAALVSLWPVNDAGTMYFMTGLYQLTEKEGKSYDEAVNIMKRKFISGEFGEFFKDPKIWAPFVHYGY